MQFTWSIWSRALILVLMVLNLHETVLGQCDSNLPPSITLTNPPSGSIFEFPSIIRLKAAANDPDGAIALVRFYEGTNLLGNVTQPPYNLFLTNVLRDGHYYFLTASATDDCGATSTSAPVRILVTQDLAPPQVFLTQPTEGEVFLLPGSITIAATVDARDGSENPVRFISGTNVIGSVAAAPYTLVVSNLAAGTHQLTAAYTDNIGNRGMSQSVRITLTPLALKAPALLSDGRFHFTITGLSTGRSFRVQAATNTFVWFLVATNFASSNIMDFIDNTVPNSSGRFYRALQDLK
jgi:hypothetical protein